MNIASLKDISALGPPPVRHTKRHAGAKTGDVTAVAAMLDYAIVEGARMRMPLFVCMLRLAQLALKEESGGGRKK